MKTTLKNNEKLKKSYNDAVLTLEKLNLEQFKDPIGLNELGQVALKDLKAFKKENSRKVTKKVIDGLEKSLLNYQEELSL